MSDSIYVPVNDVRGHRLDFKMVQLKTKTMTHVEANVEGEPASTVFTQVWSLTQNFDSYGERLAEANGIFQ